MNDDNYVEWLVKRKRSGICRSCKNTHDCGLYIFPSFQRCRPCLE